MQKDHRHKELDSVDSGMNEEEMFSSVVRPQSNNSELPHSSNANSYSSNMNNNNNNNSSYPPKYLRPNKSNPTAPRFQRNQRNQDDKPHRNNHQTQGVGNRLPNGIPPRHRKLLQVYDY